MDSTSDAMTDSEDDLTTDEGSPERRWELEQIGPSGETRAQCRTDLLKNLDKLRADVAKAADHGDISEVKAARLQLQIHREQAALLGLNVAQYSVSW